jgi:hypothetical protein
MERRVSKMALTRRDSVKLLGASLLATGASATPVRSADARPADRSDRRSTPRPERPPTTVSMKRLRALPILLDY